MSGLSRAGLVHLFVVYTVWSTTYLAMRVGVDPAGGFPPFIFGATRMALAGLILLGLARIQRQTVVPQRGELATLAVVGNLLWLGGNGLVLWAVQYANSGFACLMVSSAPIWATILELALYKKKPSMMLVGSLFVGFLGVAVLSLPSFAKGNFQDAIALAALVLSAVCWALGSVIQVRQPVKLAPQVMSAYHQLFAGAGFLAASVLLAEPLPQAGLQPWLAWGYLVIFGSVVAFTSYIFALKMLPINIAMTYAYVNPVLALGLGWLLLGESIGPWTIVGAVLVLLSVFGIFRAKQQKLPALSEHSAESRQ